jgi:hypothetical protein
MKSMLRAVLAFSFALSPLGCYSASDDHSDPGGNTDSNGGAGGASGSDGGSSAAGSNGGKGGTTSASGGTTSANGGSGDAGDGGSAGSSAGGSSSGNAGSAGTGGSTNACEIDSYTFAVSQTTSSCGFALRDLYDPTIVNVYFSVNGSQQPLCRHADSQGCELSGGYWWAGDEVALCDETCELLDVEGGYFVAVRGCETEFCSY